MDVLKRAAPAGLLLAALVAALAGCQRDFSTPGFPTAPDSTAAPAKPDTSKTRPQPKPILIESLSAADLRLNEGETRPAPVTVHPANASSPLYELTSNKPGVAEVTADGIHGAGAGTADITVRALDGSGKTAKFRVTVDAVFDLCLLPCLCLADGGGNGKGKDKDKDKCDD